MLKRALVMVAMKRIDMYSARKIMTKAIALNSVLNPLTSSDSPSVRSKGDRLVSAREERTRSVIDGKRKHHKGVIFSCSTS